MRAQQALSPHPSVHRRAEEERRLLSVREASVVLGVSEMTVRRLLDNREIEHLRVSNVIRIPEDALASYMRAATVKPLR